MDWTMSQDEPFPADVHKTMPEERTIVPVGTHTAVIKKAEEGPNQWKKDETSNPDGICLKLRLAVGNYKFVFHDLPKHQPWLAKQLADALGILPVGGKLSLSPDDLADKTVTAEVSHYTSKAGKVSAVVKRYLPATAAPAAVAPVKRQTLPQKAAATFKATAGADDIPFAWLMAAFIASVIGGGA
jgi:hypothetical protein